MSMSRGWGMSKIISIGAVLLLLIAVTGGCGGGDGEETTPESTTPPAVTTSPTETQTSEPEETSPTETTEPEETSTPTQAREELPDTYKITIVSTDTGGTSGSFTVWAKHDKIKMDITTKQSSGNEDQVILIRNENGDYMYNPEDKTGVKISDLLPQDPFEMYGPWVNYFERYQTVYNSDQKILASFETACANSPSCESVGIAGQESVAGEECTIFETTSAQGTTTKVWLATNKGYPLKAQSTTPDGSTNTVEYTEVNFDPSIPDSTFEIPPDVEIKDMSDMLSEMQQ